PEIRDHLRASNFTADQAKLNAIGAVHDQIVAAIRARDPSVFQNFRVAMVSGNELEVLEGLTLGANAMLDAVISMDDGSIASRLQEPEFNDLFTKSAEARSIDPQTMAQAKAKLQRMLAEKSQGQIDSDTGESSVDGQPITSIRCRGAADCSAVFVLAVA